MKRLDLERQPDGIRQNTGVSGETVHFAAESYRRVERVGIMLPDKVKRIIEVLMCQGFEAYAVGGCVRDSILGRIPDDWDITTSAKPEQVKKLFKRTVDTGIQHGTVTVMLGHEGFEVTTYRIDGIYEDGRHPKEVQFTSDVTEDLKRRDFTINAMAYNDVRGVVDVFGGVRDLKNRVIRCVGAAEERFMEDALRIMRAVRFSAQLGFEIEEHTLAAAAKMAVRLKDISAERIQVELTKLLVSPEPWRLQTAYEGGITAVVLPEFDDMMEMGQRNSHHTGSVGAHTLRSLALIEPEKILRLTMLLHDIGKPNKSSFDENGVQHFYGHELEGERIAENILKRLKYDNDTTRRVASLVKYHEHQVEPTSRGVRRSVSRIGEDHFLDFLKVRRADILAQSDSERQEKQKHLDKINYLYKKMLEKKECVSLKTMAITGKDLISLGMKPGKEMGEVLNMLLEMVIDNPALNMREYLLSFVESTYLSKG